MVLTRRASRAEKSIIRWLPNEVLVVVVSNLARSDLLILRRTSRLLSDIATPLLYRAISFSANAQLKAFLRTMNQPFRAAALRALSLMYGDSPMECVQFPAVFRGEKD
ncbi:hypothetical protein K438DRAFT_1997346 [Mycena galopus ATCC 62051]|nr:hypothetical protein K438DRAFT_1997346 [Mycena galopus ATCC 62051]